MEILKVGFSSKEQQRHQRIISRAGPRREHRRNGHLHSGVSIRDHHEELKSPFLTEIRRTDMRYCQTSLIRKIHESLLHALSSSGVARIEIIGINPLSTPEFPAYNPQHKHSHARLREIASACWALTALSDSHI